MNADEFIDGLPAPHRKRAAQVRTLVYELAPDTQEKVTWDAISIYDPSKGGPIKGSVCQIVFRNGLLRLDFPLGSLMDDEHGLLQAVPSRKGKRFVPLTSKTPTMAQMTALIHDSLDSPDKPKRL